MKVIDVSQRSEGWFNWRRMGISASDIATIIGYNENKTPWRLWAEKTGKVDPELLDANPNIRRGIRQEDWVRQRFEERHDDVLLPVCVESTENPLFRSSLDGITVSHEPTELKAPHVNTFRDVLEYGRASKAFLLYWPQVQQQIYTTGASKGYLCFLCVEVNPGEQDYVEFEIPRDETFIREEMIPAGLEFWDMLQSKKEPKKDPLRDVYIPDASIMEQWEKQIDDFRRVKAFADACALQKKGLDERLREKKTELAQLMGDYRMAQACGIGVTRFTKKGSIDWNQLIADKLPDLKDEEIEFYRGMPGKEQVRVTEKKAAQDVAEREQAIHEDWLAQVTHDTPQSQQVVW